MKFVAAPVDNKLILVTILSISQPWVSQALVDGLWVPAVSAGSLGSIFNLSRGVDASELCRLRSDPSRRESGIERGQFAAAAKCLDAIKAAKLLL